MPRYTEERERPSRSGKDRARWCRGRVGIPHQYAEMRTPSFTMTHICQRCTVCGRRLWRTSRWEKLPA